MKITINLTDAQYKALAYVAVDPRDWIQNAAITRANAAIDEMFQVEIQRMIADPTITQIPADKEAVVLASTLPSAAESSILTETPASEAPSGD